MSNIGTPQSPAQAGARAREPLHRAEVVMIVVNLLGAALYLRQANYGWADPVERAAGVTTLTGEPFVWFLAVMPVVIAYLLINVAWLFVALARRRRQSAMPLALTAGLWVVAVAIDFAHH